MLSIGARVSIDIDATSAPVVTAVATEAQTEVPSPDDVSDLENEHQSPDVDKVSENLPISPSEDVTMYGDLIRIALGFSCLDQMPQVSDVVFEVVHQDVLAVVSSVLLQFIQSTWVHPASAPILMKKLDHMYRIQESTAAFLYVHPKPNSLIISSLSKGRGLIPPLQTGIIRGLIILVNAFISPER